MSATRCYCGERLRPDGTCRHRCPPSASPKHLRAIDQARRLAEAKANVVVGAMLNEQDMKKHSAPRAALRNARRAAMKRARIEKRRGSQCQGQK